MADRVLVVEDEAIVAADVSDRLRSLGYEVVGTAATADKAVELVRTKSPDVVLMDVMLRDRSDGIEAADRIRTISGVPVIFATAHTDDHTLRRSRLAGAFGYVVKPFNDRELQAAIELALFRHDSEHKLRRMEQWLSTTLRSIGEGILTTDGNGHVTFLNQKAEELTGWSRLSAVGRHVGEILTLTSSSGDVSVADPVSHALDSGDTVDPGTGLALRRFDDRLLPVGVSAAPIRGDDGTVSGAVVVFHDRSEHIAAEETQRDIERKVHEAQRLESLGALAGGIAHDFNNLLAVILGNAELCRSSLPGDSMAQKYLSEIERSSQKAADLCQQMLAYAGQGSYQVRPMSLSWLVTDTTGLLRASIGSNIALNLQAMDDLPMIRGDSGQLRQVLVNLVTNAAEAIGMDEGVITLRTWPATLEQAAAARFDPPLQRGEYTVLEVRDDGCGMDQATLDRLFDPFFTTKFTGRGLGLAAVKGIVQSHGGRITVRSQSQEGTTIRVYLPVNAAGGTAPAAPEDTATSSAGHRILLADDEPAVRSITRQMLEHSGYEVVEAQDGEQAVRLFDEAPHSFYLVLLDLTMPRRNGFDALQSIRSIKPGVRSILMSGYSESDTLHRLGRHGPDGFLQKPFTPTQLTDAIDRLAQADAKA